MVRSFRRNGRKRYETSSSRERHDARWVNKRSKSTLGYKAFARADDDGSIDRVHTTPVNQAESPQFTTMVDGAKPQGQASRANRAALRC
jgi:transposase, IS5 family